METYRGVLKYVRGTVPVNEYETGWVDYPDIDSYYRNVTIRDKVIIKMDLAKFYEEYFEKETIAKYKPVIFMIAKGLVTDPTTLSNVIMDFINNDRVFKKQITTLYYSCPDDMSFGHHIMNTLAMIPTRVEEDLRSFFRGKPSVVICTSDGYLYFSIEDTTRIPLLPYEIEYEVLSNVKSWRGTFTVV